AVKAVLGELLLFGESDVAVGLIVGPAQIIDTLDALQESAYAFEAVRQFHGDRIQVNAAALLEVGELCNFESVEKNLPADAPRTERWRFPVVLFKANVVLFQIQTDCSEALQINILDVGGRRLQDYLKLRMLVEAIGILPIATVGGPTARLYISD